MRSFYRVTIDFTWAGYTARHRTAWYGAPPNEEQSLALAELEKDLINAGAVTRDCGCCLNDETFRVLAIDGVLVDGGVR